MAELDELKQDAIRSDNAVEQSLGQYRLTFPIMINNVTYTKVCFWPSPELTGAVQEMLYDSPFLHTNPGDTTRILLSRVVKDLITDDGEVLSVSPPPRGILTITKPVPSYAKAEKIIGSLFEPDADYLSFVYQRDYVQSVIPAKYACRRCAAEFSMQEDLTTYREVSPEECILRTLEMAENHYSAEEVEYMFEGMDAPSLLMEKLPEGMTKPGFSCTVDNGVSSVDGERCRTFKFKVLTVAQTTMLAKKALGPLKGKMIAINIEKISQMLSSIPGADDRLAIQRQDVIRSIPVADRLLLVGLINSSFWRINMFGSKMCPECGAQNRNTRLDVMGFFGMGTSV